MLLELPRKLPRRPPQRRNKLLRKKRTVRSEKRIDCDGKLSGNSKKRRGSGRKKSDGSVKLRRKNERLSENGNARRRRRN